MRLAGSRAERIDRADSRRVSHNRIIVMHPFADVAGQIVEPGRLSRKTPDWSQAGVSIGVIRNVEPCAALGALIRNIPGPGRQNGFITPREHRLGRASRSARQPLPFGLRQQPVAVRGRVEADQFAVPDAIKRRQVFLAAQPVAEHRRIQPANSGHGQLGRAAVVGLELAKLGVGNFVFARIERFPEGHLPLKLVGPLALLVTWRAHGETGRMK